MTKTIPLAPDAEARETFEALSRKSLELQEERLDVASRLQGILDLHPLDRPPQLVAKLGDRQHALDGEIADLCAQLRRVRARLDAGAAEARGLVLSVSKFPPRHVAPRDEAEWSPETRAMFAGAALTPAYLRHFAQWSCWSRRAERRDSRGGRGRPMPWGFCAHSDEPDPAAHARVAADLGLDHEVLPFSWRGRALAVAYWRPLSQPAAPISRLSWMGGARG